MKIFAISDLHLSLITGYSTEEGKLYKPMSVFGDKWEAHHLKIADNWWKLVGPEDVVLVPGDHSWALTLAQALPDLAFIGELPGQKVLIKGNHDFWWESIGKVRQALPEGILALQNDAINLNGVVVSGTRGWITPLDEDFNLEDKKIFERELLRLEMSLKAAIKLGGDLTIVMMHYPPSLRGQETEFTRLLTRFGIEHCVYGHLHSEYGQYLNGIQKGVKYHLVSCDFLDFKPKLILEV